MLPYYLKEGSRSEYLAWFALSAFGPSVQIPRQEDYGIDFICNIESKLQEKADKMEEYKIDELKSKKDDIKKLVKKHFNKRIS